jgi:hypothetical protein
MRRITPLRRGILLTALALLLALPSFGASTSTAGYWRFEEGTPGADASGEDSIIDSSGSGDHGTPFGGPTYRADVPVDRVRASGAVNRRSLEFHGPNDRVFFSSKFLFHKPVDATLEFWLKFSPLGHQSVFWTRHDNDDLNRFNIFVNGDSTIGFDYQTPSGDLHRLVGECCTGVRVPPHAWSHIAITRAGDVYRLYVNGQLRATATDSIRTFQPRSDGRSQAASLSRSTASSMRSAFPSAPSSRRSFSTLAGRSAREDRLRSSARQGTTSSAGRPVLT